MPDTQITLFIMASLMVILSPGQDMVLVLSKAMSGGARAGITTAAGVSFGLLGHTALATLGLGALLQASPISFTLMKYAGAAYLVYIGIRAFYAQPIILTATSSGVRLREVFLQGALSNVSNPKVAIFYFAYLPQFVSSQSQNPAWELFLLGTGFALLTFFAKLPIGYIAGKSSLWFQTNPKFQNWLNRISGGVLIGLGLRLATIDR